MGINWDDFDTPGEFPQAFKFRNIGDKAVGEVYYVRTTDFGGTAEKVPEIWIRQDDGTEIGVAASQVNLRRLLCLHRPTAGDRIAIVYTGDATSTKAGFSPAKQFDVVVRRPGDVTPTLSTQPRPVTPEPAPQQTPSPVTASSLI